MAGPLKATSVFLVLAILLAGCGQAEETAAPELPSTLTEAPPTANPTATATPDPTAVRFIEIPEQTTIQGDVFLTLDLYAFLRFRNFTADQMTWSATGSQHITASISNGLITATPNPAWYGTESIQVEACEPSGACASQDILYTAIDKTTFSGVKVTFVGNSGFLVTVKDKKILVDALFEGFPPGYTLPAEVQNLILNARPPFDNIDLILATHDHADHFSAAMVQQHMQNDPDTVFVSTTQAVGRLTMQADSADLDNRVIAVDPTVGKAVTVEANGIQVEAIYLNHGYPPNSQDEVFNNGYVMTVNGIKFFHMGDIGDPQDLLQYKLADQHIDLAFVQHFYLQDDRAKSIIEDGLGAKYLFPIHYQFTDPPFDAGMIRAVYPDAVIFSKELESWYMP